jgi:putative flippase GtrA
MPSPRSLERPVPSDFRSARIRAVIQSDAFRQFLRFATVGVVSNLVIYGAYLLLTALGMGAKLAMTTTYVAGVVQTFIVNKRWTFDFDGAGMGVFVRYCLSYAFGYVVNLLTLYVFADRLGWPHQLVQAGAIVEVAVLLFALHRFWVFRAPTSSAKAARD